jgi:hypothetical protein
MTISNYQSLAQQHHALQSDLTPCFTPGTTNQVYLFHLSDDAFLSHMNQKSSEMTSAVSLALSRQLWPLALLLATKH